MSGALDGGKVLLSLVLLGTGNSHGSEFLALLTLSIVIVTAIALRAVWAVKLRYVLGCPPSKEGVAGEGVEMIGDYDTGTLEEVHLFPSSGTSIPFPNTLSNPEKDGPVTDIREGERSNAGALGPMRDAPTAPLE